MQIDPAVLPGYNTSQTDDRQTDRQTDRRHAVAKARPIVRSTKNEVDRTTRSGDMAKRRAVSGQTDMTCQPTGHPAKVTLPCCSWELAAPSFSRKHSLLRSHSHSRTKVIKYSKAIT